MEKSFANQVGDRRTKKPQKITRMEMHKRKIAEYKVWSQKKKNNASKAQLAEEELTTTTYTST